MDWIGCGWVGGCVRFVCSFISCDGFGILFPFLCNMLCAVLWAWDMMTARQNTIGLLGAARGLARTV